MSKQPLRVGIIGMGGFAGAHHDAVRELESAGRCRLMCACDPDPSAFAERARKLGFAERGVGFYDNYARMLQTHERELDLVTIPTPVPLHAPMHRACVTRGIPVYLEKPPTLNCQELEDMLLVEATARACTNVGFNFIVEPERQALKRRILDGEFGAVRKVSLLGFAPRPRSYFRRAPWAGRLVMDGRLVLDSCFGNAMAHLVHNALFWPGSGSVLSWAGVERVEAELYRARRIQGFDTVFARAVTTEGPEVLVAMSHSCEPGISFRERITCEKATISYTVAQRFRIDWADGRQESGEVGQVHLIDNLSAYLDYLEGKVDRPLNLLADCRPFVMFNSLLYIAAANIHSIPSESIELSITDGHTDETPRIRGLLPACEEFLSRGTFPSAQACAWGRPGGEAAASDVSRLAEVVDRIAQESPELEEDA